MKKISFFKGNPKGSITIEVLFAVLIFSMGLAGVSSLITSAIYINNSNHNRTIALNLAREGIEAVRNMRDTNWMTQSADMRECWNFWDNTNEDDVVDNADGACVVDNEQNTHPFGLNNAGNFIEDYIVDFNETSYRWALIEKTSDDQTKLYKNPAGLYTHDPDGNANTVFRREVAIRYIDNEEEVLPATVPPVYTYKFPVASPTRDNRIMVIITVKWYNQGGGGEKELALATTLTDYLSRTDVDE